MNDLTKKICEVMGWRSYRGKYPDPATCMHDAKLLQARMVEDGWNIEIHNWQEKFPDFPAQVYFSITASNNYESIEHADAASEPAALCALFVKVYNIDSAPIKEG